MRVTTNSIVRNYSSNLNTVLVERNRAGERVTTHRQFMKSSEDPTAAYKASQLHRKYLQNQDYISTVKDTQDLLKMAESSMMSLEEASSKVLGDYTLSALNGTNAEQRATYAEILRQTQKTMLQFANVTYGGKHILSGQDTDKTPFTIDADGKISYLGLDVNDPANAAALEDLMKEKIYVDIGLGISSTTPANDTNAFNTAISGIQLLGYGTNADGVSKNLISLAGQMADELDRGDAFDTDKFNKMLDQFKLSYDNLVEEHASVGVKDNYLESTLGRLEELDISYQEQIDSVEYVDDAAAITDYTYAQYAYNAALRVGTSLLSSSLLDFLN